MGPRFLYSAILSDLTNRIGPFIGYFLLYRVDTLWESIYNDIYPRSSNICELNEVFWLTARPLPSSGFRVPKSGFRSPEGGQMRTPEFRRIGDSPDFRIPELGSESDAGQTEVDCEQKTYNFNLFP